MIALSCETDFVAKNELFQQFGQTLLDTAFIHRPATLEELLSLVAEDGMQIKEKITELVGKIGEKVAVTDYAILNSETVVSYMHIGAKLGVLVGMEGEKNESIIAVGKDIAMHIAAMNPLAIDKDDTDTTSVDQENILLIQPFVKNNGLTIAQHLANSSSKVKITAFKRVSIV